MTFNHAMLDLIDARVAAGARRITAVGTIVERTSATMCTVILDGSALVVPVKVFGDVAANPGDRVCLAKFGFDWVVVGTFAPPRGVIARTSRPTASTASASAQGVLRLDDVPIFAGRLYRVSCPTFILIPSVANDQDTARLSATFDGSTPTTGSTIYAVWNTPAIDSTSNGASGSLEFNYIPTGNETLSVLLWTQRLVGSGTARLAQTAGTTIDIIVEDLGVPPPDTGTDI
jgi:hypothetical protein